MNFSKSPNPKSWRASGFAVVAAGLFLALQVQAETPEEENSIGRRLEEVEKASVFIDLLKDTDRSKNLLFSSRGNLTVFVPTNEAFEKLDEDRRKALFSPGNKHWRERVLAYHAIHNDRIDRYILTRVGLIRNGENQFLDVDLNAEKQLTIDGANVIETDFACANGVVHFIDEVLDPIEPDLFETLEEDGRFELLCQLLKRTGLTKLLQNRHQDYTIFAPTDEAFSTLPKGVVEQLQAPENLDLLSDVIKAHIVEGVQTVDKVPGNSPLGTPGIDVRNQYEQELTYRVRGEIRTIDGVEIKEYDRVARNGIYHVIAKPISVKRDSVLAALEEKGNYGIFLDLLRQSGLYDLLGSFSSQVTVFAPVDETFVEPEAKAMLEKLRDDASVEQLRGVLQRHIIRARIPLNNAIDYQRFSTALSARVDVTREGDKRWVQGVEIVETDVLARNGIVHGIRGVISPEMELPDRDQQVADYLVFVNETLERGSELFTDLKYRETTEWYASRGYEFLARYQPNLKAQSGIDASAILNRDRTRNLDYDFADTAWTQRNKFQNLLRELEKVRRKEFDLTRAPQ
ncbi:MAG: fasciclin domain-containing protein [Verrucomicrobiota bacterium]